MSKMNLLLNEPSIENNLINFENFNASDFLSAIQESIEISNKNVQAYLATSNDNFESNIEDFLQISSRLDFIYNLFQCFLFTHATEEINKNSTQISELVVNFENELYNNVEIFNKIKNFENLNLSQMTDEQKRCVEKILKSFIDNGCNLSSEKKQKIKEIDVNLANLSIKFSDNIRKSTSSFKLFLSEEQMDGIPKRLKDSYRQKSIKENRENEYLITLDYPSMYGFMSNSQNRELRKKVYKAYASRAYKGDTCNLESAKSILQLREQRATLLGYKNHGEYILKDRMAATIENVIAFNQRLLDRSKIQALKDKKILGDFAKDNYQIDNIQNYDLHFLINMYKEKNFQIDMEEVRKYFPLKNVLSGLFKVVSNLYDLKIEEIYNPVVYFEGVRLFKLTHNKTYLGHLYMDLFPREEKSAGAWMMDLKRQVPLNGTTQRPSVGIACNFTKSSDENLPDLLDVNEVETLFHEFGHALHGLFSKVKYGNLAGTNVTWDFVELPSQILENWIFEDEVLDLISGHYKTQEKLPKVYVDKLKEMKNLFNGIGILRQARFSHLDINVHLKSIKDNDDLCAIEKELTKDFDLFDSVEGSSALTSFSHIFDGGYSVGYYSYHWASVLEADAYESFKTHGIFNKEIAKSFRENILEKGDSVDPSILYRNFKGSDPSEEAFFKREGI